MPSVPENLPVEDRHLQSPCTPLSRHTMNPSQMTDMAMNEGRRGRKNKRKVFTGRQSVYVCLFMNALLHGCVHLCEDISFVPVVMHKAEYVCFWEAPPGNIACIPLIQ